MTSASRAETSVKEERRVRRDRRNGSLPLSGVEKWRFAGALETYDSEAIILLLGKLAYLGNTFARTKVCGAELLAWGFVLLL
jgi:hypothetical protein